MAHSSFCPFCLIVLIAEVGCRAFKRWFKLLRRGGLRFQLDQLSDSYSAMQCTSECLFIEIIIIMPVEEQWSFLSSMDYGNSIFARHKISQVWIIAP